MFYEDQEHKMDNKLSLSLIENSSDYFGKCYQICKRHGKRDWKYVLLNLANAIELVMKAVLEKEHWSLLFENVDSANKEILSKGDFQSVNFKTAFERLKCIIESIFQ